MDDGDLSGALVADRYRILQKMGEGGMGTVYLAEHVTIEKKVALKVLLHQYARKQDLKDRFLQEAKAAARIGHENIVDITDFGDSPDGSVFFAMEFLDGIDLAQLIRKEGPIPWSRAKPILLQICRALGAAHSKGIIHRDMKPENIYLIEREGRSDFVKVLDFGIAKMSMENEGQRLTRTGMIFGTPEYMSPEQAQGNKPDHRVDVYAVGVIMYELLTGEVPFKADTFMGILTKHIFEQPVPPSQLKPDLGIPAEVEALVLQALAKERTERFRSMAEMAAAIAQASGRMTRPTGTNPVTPRIVTPAGALPSYAAGSDDVSLPPQGLTTGVVPEEAAIYSHGRTRLVLVIALGVLLIASGALAIILRHNSNKEAVASKPDQGPTIAASVKRRDTKVQAAAAPQPAQQHVIRIESFPVGALIYRGQRQVGSTPGEVTLEHGPAKVLLTIKKEGFQEKGLEVTPLQNQTFSIQLVPLKPPPAVQRPRPHPAGRPVVPAKRPPDDKKPPVKRPPKGSETDPSSDLMNPF